MKFYSAIVISIFLLCACSGKSEKESALGGGGEQLWIPYDNAQALINDLETGKSTSESIVENYLLRIKEIDQSGPELQSILQLNPRVLQEARILDLERKNGAVRGRLHGVPILVKDNIETLELPTTAGSLALSKNHTNRDAPIIAKLRAQGALILGKSNLSEWANFRSSHSISGWSAIGGQTRNPHSLDRSPCGSSSGSGSAIAAQLAPLAIGTETNGSVICPSAMNGVVGFKPTVGLLSRRHIVPISSTQDTAGPMTRSVADAALMLEIMAGTDDADVTTLEADKNRKKYTELIDKDISGMRIGVLRFGQGSNNKIIETFETALSKLEEQGAVLVDISGYNMPDDLWANELQVLQYELKDTLNTYLGTSADAVSTRTLAELIAFNNQSGREMALFEQDLFIKSEETEGLTDEVYIKALASVLKATREDGIDKLLGDNGVEVLVVPAYEPAFLIEPVFGDQFVSLGIGATWMAAIAGYPSMTVPMGEYKGLPIGLGIMASAWEDDKVLQVGYAYEKNSREIIKPRFALGTEYIDEFREKVRVLPTDEWK